MKLIYYSLTTLWHNKATTAIKVVSFALGLGICIILFTRIAYDLSYDTCLNGYENLYQLKTDYKTAGNESGQIAECYGGLAGALLRGVARHRRVGHYRQGFRRRLILDS